MLCPSGSQAIPKRMHLAVIQRMLDPWQYLLSQAARPGAQPVGNFWLEVGADLPVCPVIDSHGRSVGVLLGFPIDLANRTVITGVWQTTASFGPDTDSFAQAILSSVLPLAINPYQ